MLEVEEAKKKTQKQNLFIKKDSYIKMRVN